MLDLGCGNGSFAARLAAEGYDVLGVDPSIEGIEQGRRAFPTVRLELGPAYDDLTRLYDRFPAVVSLEVAAHVYAPRVYARTLFEITDTGGTAIVATPYHGYLKNLALVLSGGWDSHYGPLWDHGHIKFWSPLQPSMGSRVKNLTPLILTYDEAANIGRVLDRLAWAERIVIVDSGSTDGTQEIVALHPRVEVFHRPFDSFAAQCNFGLDQIDTEWVLSLDADYIPSEALVNEIRALPDDPGACAYRARFVYCVGGRPLRASLYPPRTVLYRKDRARYEDDGHGHRIRVGGPVAILRCALYHDDRKPIARWLQSQDRYAELEAEKLCGMPRERLGRVDRLRRLGWLVPFLTPAYCLLAKGLLLDGRAGLHYTFQRTYAELLLALKLMELRSSPPAVRSGPKNSRSLFPASIEGS